MDPRLLAEIEAQPHRLVYATLAGEHLYGMAGADSTYDVRAMHVLPAREVVGLRTPAESIAYTAHRDGLDLEYLSHDVKKVCLMVLKKNGNVLEQICSPHVLHAGPELEEFRALARACASRHMGHHFLKHADLQWTLCSGENPPRIQAMLLALRVLLTGLHLLRTGEVEADLPALGERFGLAYLEELIARRVDGGEAARLDARETGFLGAEHERLRAELERARNEGPLPAAPPDDARAALDRFLVRVRLGT